MGKREREGEGERDTGCGCGATDLIFLFREQADLPFHHEGFHLPIRARVGASLLGSRSVTSREMGFLPESSRG